MAIIIISGLTGKANVATLFDDEKKEQADVNLKEIYCNNCKKSFGLYNEKYFSDKDLEKMKTHYGSLHIFYGHDVIISLNTKDKRL